MSRIMWIGVGLIAASGLLAGCRSGDGVAGGERELSIEVDRQSGRSFAAVGEAVDDRLVCPSGRARSSGFTALDGSPMTLEEFATLRATALEADPPDVTIGYLLDVEFDCTDGSGTISMVVEERNGGAWHIVSGTGAHRELTGSGTLRVERDPPTGPDDPPGGVVHWNHMTGTVASG